MQPVNEPGDPALIDIIRQAIEQQGPISFAQYMELALYEPQHGYYTQRPGLGRGGDFVTSPELHHLFGACLARQVTELWVALDRPSPLALLEWGAGTAALARDLLTDLTRRHPNEQIDYMINEISPALIERQRRTLADGGLAARWTSVGAPAVGLVLANELLDALPVHRVTRRNGLLHELRVDWQADDFVEVARPLQIPALADYLTDGQIDLVEGQVAEINLAALEWLAAVAADLERGAVLIIDYGDTTAELYGPRRRRGTLLGYHSQTVNEEPFRRVGQQDLTAHVDFGALMRRAGQLGLHVAGLTSQGAFLAGLGLGEALIELQRQLPARDYLGQRDLIAGLIRPDRLGGFKVLILTRGLPTDLALAGLAVRL